MERDVGLVLFPESFGDFGEVVKGTSPVMAGIDAVTGCSKRTRALPRQLVAIINSSSGHHEDTPPHYLSERWIVCADTDS
jgi:hypothetical protein